MSRLALKIAATHGTTLLLDDRRIPQIEVRPEWIALHEPEAGGYYLIDDDGRATFSATLPEDVPAPAERVDPARLVPLSDHFKYDWLQQWFEVFYAQGEALRDEIAALKARVDAP